MSNKQYNLIKQTNELLHRLEPTPTPFKYAGKTKWAISKLFIETKTEIEPLKIFGFNTSIAHFKTKTYPEVKFLVVLKIWHTKEPFIYWLDKKSFESSNRTYSKDFTDFDIQGRDSGRDDWYKSFFNTEKEALDFLNIYNGL